MEYPMYTVHNYKIDCLILCVCAYMLKCQPETYLAVCWKRP